MARPGVVVTSRADAPPRSAPTDTSMGFMVGATEIGTKNVDTATSMTEYQAKFGVRTGFTDAYDAAEVFFREGGGKLTVSRLNGVGAEYEELVEAPKGKAGADTQVVDPTITNALARFPRSMGPGQVFVVGTLAQAVDTQNALLDHAAANNRVALLEAPATSTATALAAIAAALRPSPNARYGALFAPAVTVPGVTAGTTRQVPASALLAGMIARNDASYSPNVPVAGDNGQSRFALAPTALYTDTERDTLNTAGVDLVRIMYGGVRAYGYRSLVDPTTSAWAWFNNVRLNMAITALAEEIGERYLFAQIDGRRVTISQFGADLAGMLVPFYEAGSLFGESADDAFYVDVGPAVNTLATIAAGELHAVIGARMSPFAEYVVIEIVKVATQTPLSQVA